MALLPSRHQKVNDKPIVAVPLAAASESNFQSDANILKRVLKPGGWAQMVECYYMCQSDNGSITQSHPLHEWSTAYISALDEIKNPRAPMQLQTLFHAAGFVEVESKMIPLPLSGWSTGEAPWFVSALYSLRRACPFVLNTPSMEG